jgi:hypothetical protein
MDEAAKGFEPFAIKHRDRFPLQAVTVAIE